MRLSRAVPAPTTRAIAWPTAAGEPRCPSAQGDGPHSGMPHELWPLADATSRSEDHRGVDNTRQGAPCPAQGAARVLSSGAAAALTWHRGHCQPCVLAAQRQRQAREQRPTAATAPVLQQKARRRRDQDVQMSHKPRDRPCHQLRASEHASGEMSTTSITISGKNAAA